MTSYLSSSGTIGTPHGYHPNPGMPMVGSVWYDKGPGQLQVFDGSNWVPLIMPQASLSWEANEAITHVLNSMRNEDKISDLADKYPLVADAIEQLEVALKLCQNLDNGQ